MSSKCDDTQIICAFRRSETDHPAPKWTFRNREEQINQPHVWNTLVERLLFLFVPNDNKMRAVNRYGHFIDFKKITFCGEPIFYTIAASFFVFYEFEMD